MKNCYYFAYWTICFSLSIALVPASAAVPEWLSACARLLTVGGAKGSATVSDPFQRFVSIDLGFDADFEGTALIEKAIAAHLRAHPNANPDSIDIQDLRRLDDLEKKIGWQRVWTGHYQAALNRRRSVALMATNSFDGLLYLPGPDGKSVVVYGDTYEAETPAQYISQANGGKAVVLSETRVLQKPVSERGTAQPLRFTAVVRPVDSNRPLGPGEVILSQGPFVMESARGFLVKPFKVDRETLGLSKSSNGTYDFQVHIGYRFLTRAGQNQTLSYSDIEDVITTALGDAGLSRNMARGSIRNGVRKIELDPSTPSDVRARFERELVRRVVELENFLDARLSRLSPLKDGVEEGVALATESSGYASPIDAQNALGLKTVDGSSTYFDSSPWHATHPILAKEGDLFYLSVDDRIYSEMRYLPGLEALGVARNKPMSAVPMPGGGYLVYYKANRAAFWSGYFEEYALFSTLERAENYIKTHRFVVDENRRY